MRYILSLLALVTLAFGQAAPSITNVTNAAIPTLDYPPASIHLAPRSLATIFGTNLADTTLSTTSPGSTLLGGSEVHLADDTCFDSSCDLIASLIYVSPTQINFLVPDNGSTSCKNCTPTAYRIVFVRDGQRIDDRSYILGGPGRLYIDPFYIADYNVVFQVGYDCLFSYSLSDPASCGLSWSQGQDRALTGAMTDALSGQLISFQYPVHQGQVVTLWMTGLYGGVTLNNLTGLLTANTPAPIGFGVAQLGNDIPATIGVGSEGPYGTFTSPLPTWAGESPQFVGLDQVNLAFPTCADTPATTEKRYDAFLTYTSVETSTTVRVYLPFFVRPGDPDCRWAFSTTTTLTSSVNPSVAGQTVTFTATVSPSAATGMVTFLDGSIPLGSGTLSNGIATFTTSDLSAGDHSIEANYSGDSKYETSFASRAEAVKQATTTAVTSSANPSISGQSLIFTATVSPSDATGTVTFFNGNSTLGVGAVSSGKATCGTNNSCSTSGLGFGSLLIRAIYSGDNNYGGSSGTLTQAMTVNTTTTVTSSANPSTFGQTVTFTATVSCCIATGTVTFLDGSTTIGSGTVVYLPINGVIKATFSTASLSVGAHSITARYNGDSNSNGSTSTVLPLTIWTISLSSSPNPSFLGQTVTFTACGIPNGVPGTVAFMDGTAILGTNNNVFSPCSSYGTNILSTGNHTITAHYSDSGGGSTSATVTQTVSQTINSTTTLTSGSVPGGVILTAMVLPSGALGSIQFFDNGVMIGSANTQPAIITLNLSSGTHSITAKYVGNSNYNSSTSSALVITGTATTITSSLNPSVIGQSVTFNATVSPSSPTGTVTFNANGLPIVCSSGSSLINGQANCSTTFVAGTFSITALYDSNNISYSGSSAGLTQTVNGH